VDIEIEEGKLTDGIICIKYLYHTLDELMLMEFSIWVKIIQILKRIHSPKIAR
jgi:hypothetical protein